MNGENESFLRFCLAVTENSLIFALQKINERVIN